METFLIFIFGILGGCLRLGITDLINYHIFPIATLLINLLGSFILPVWTNWGYKKLHLSETINRAIGTGFIGSFTTFSGIMLDSLRMIQLQEWIFLSIYLFSTIVFGVILAMIGANISTEEESK